MAKDKFDALIVGGGAAGIAAGRRLHDAGVDCLILEARDRLGGRAWTVEAGGFPVDLGCGWLHSGDRNPWTAIASGDGFAIDETPPPWMRPSLPVGFPPKEQQDFRRVLMDFYERVDAFGEEGPDVPAANLLDSAKWSGLVNAVSSFVNGAELDRMSARDFSRYADTGVNWRVVEGYGAAIARHAAGVPVRYGAPVRRIDHGGARLKLETDAGALTAEFVIVTVPSNLIAEEAIRFTPALPDKVEAAAGLPLGLADKLFLSLRDAEEFEKDSRVFGRTDRSATAAYHFRPFGRPLIEAYFAGSNAAELEKRGEAAFLDFAIGELTGLLGTDFAKRVAPLRLHRWRADEWARGSYSHALPGRADERARLAAPVDGRLFFAGEACSRHDFSTAHGAYFTGIEAADHVLAGRGRRNGG